MNGMGLERLMSTPDNSLRNYLNKRESLRSGILISALLILIFLSLVSLCIGSAHLTLAEVNKIVFSRFRGEGASIISPGKYSVIWDIRLPRILMALLCGASLSTGGVAMQGILRNPLVSPYTLGISAASAFGASLAIIGGHYNLVIPGAFVMSLSAVSFVLILAHLRGMNSQSLILAGIAVMYAFSAGTSLLQYLATQDQLAKIVFWLMGSLSSTTWDQTKMTAIAAAIALPVLYRFSWKLNIINAGEETALSLGVNSKSVMFIIVIVVTLLSSIIVSFTGVIGFIGLAGPHISRLLVGSDYKVLFPATALTGAFLLLISDTIARTLLGNTELPIGIITSLIGVPFLISILLNKQRREVT